MREGGSEGGRDMDEEKNKKQERSVGLNDHWYAVQSVQFSSVNRGLKALQQGLLMEGKTM